MLDHVYDNYEPQNVFVYGTLKKGYGNNLLLTRGDSTFIDDAQSVEHTYQMCSNGGFPMIKDRLEEAQELGAVMGELYQINDVQTFLALDTLESNGILYQREQRDFLCLEDNVIVSAWVYLYLQEMPETFDSFFYLYEVVKPGEDILTISSWTDEEKKAFFWKSRR